MKNILKKRIKNENEKSKWKNYYNYLFIKNKLA